ncbi:MAG TPA: Gfo/Idh/MocA family oxidoreductase [bacterium]|nr:Gfo/Idh/MocA family oxidoreductase [bacterium]
MKHDPVKAAVIGVGYLGRFHARKYASIPEARLLYCVDADGKRAAEVAAETGSKPATDYRSVIEEVDAVSIAVPTPRHFEVARDCLNAGCDILLEKPITETVAQAGELIELARAKNRVFMAGHLERFNPPIMKLKNTVVKPAFIEADRLGPFKERAANIDVVLDLMIHDLDIVLSFVRAPISRISAVGIPVLSDKVDIANARIEFQNGAAANLTASRVSLGEAVRKIRIFQHESYISIDYQAQKMAVFTLGQGRDDDPMSRIMIEEVKLDRQDALEQEVRSFLYSVRTRQKPPVSGEDGKLALETAIAVLDCIRRTPRPEDLD